MRPLILLVSTLLSCVSAASAAAQHTAFTSDSVRAILPAGTLRVDAMDLAPSPRLAELTARLQAAIQRDPAWFQQAVREAEPGEPLAYDARMGITRAEYDEYQRLLKNVELAKVAEGTLTVRAEGARLVFDGGRSMPDLTGVAIDLETDQLVTPWGTVTGSREVHHDGEGAAIGARDGRTWETERMTADGRDVTVISLFAGRLRESGRGVLYWQARQVRGGQPVTRFVRILFYDVLD